MDGDNIGNLKYCTLSTSGYSDYFFYFSSHTNEFLKDTREDEGSATGSTGQVKPPHKLNERERKQAALPILIFGYPLVSQQYQIPRKIRTFPDKGFLMSYSTVL